MKTNFLCITLLCAINVCATAQKDIIVTIEAQKIEAKILEVSPTEIKYKEVDYIDGPTFVLPTSNINTIIFANGKVSVYNTVNTNKHDAEQIPITPEEVSLYQKYPKELVVKIGGDYSMLFNKNAKVFLFVTCDDAEVVEFGYRKRGITKRYPNFSEYCKVVSNCRAFDINNAISGACEKFNNYSLAKEKCTLIPYKSEPMTSDDYSIVFKINKVDVGDEGVSRMSLNTGTQTGGAIVCGIITIYDAQKTKFCEIEVDRIQGNSSASTIARLENAIEEIFGNKIFYLRFSN